MWTGLVWGCAAAVSAAAEPAAVVANVKVVSSAVKDVSSLEAWKQSCIRDGMSDRDKALAIWETIVAHQFQDSPPSEFLNNEGTVQDALKMMNVYGYSLCGVAANEIVSLARYVGLEARISTINLHVVPEIQWDGAWHMLDASLINFFIFRDQPADAANGKLSPALSYYNVPNGKIASIEEIQAAVHAWYDQNPDALNAPAKEGAKPTGNDAKLRAYHTAGGWQGWKRGPQLLTDCPFYDDSGWLPAHTHGWYSTMQEYDGSTCFPYEAGYSLGYKVNIQLRPGERIVRNWSNKGLYVNMDGTGGEPYALHGKIGEEFLAYARKFGDKAPGRIGNGTLEYNVPLDATLVRHAWRFENLVARDGALEITDAATQGILEIRNPCSYVYLQGEVALDATLGPGGSVGVYLSDNHGLDWTPIGKIGTAGRQTFDLSASILRRYDYRLRVLLDGAGTRLTAMAFRHDFQHSQRPLPALDRGTNTITFSAGLPEGTVTIEGAISPSSQGKQLRYVDFRPIVQDLRPDNLMVDVDKGTGFIRHHIETPGPMIRMNILTHYRARDKKAGWDVQVSFDEGKTFRSVGHCPGGHPAYGSYLVITDIPPETKSAEVQWIGTAANNATLIFNQRVDADYELPNAGFRPVKVTYDWEEGGIKKQDVHVMQAAQETHTITCENQPTMKSIAMELAE